MSAGNRYAQVRGWPAWASPRQTGFMRAIPVESPHQGLIGVARRSNMRDFISGMENRLRKSDARSRWLTIALIAALPCLNLIVFSWLAASTMVSRDQWYFIPMVRDYLTGDFHLFSLWETHSQHRTPGYKLLFLLNADFFRLNMRIDVMLGLVALTSSVLLLMRRFRDTLPIESKAAPLWLGLASFAVIGFNMNQWYDTTYALTAFGGYASILCFVVLWLMLDTQLRHTGSSLGVASLCLMLAFTLMIFAGGMGPALIMSMLGVSALAMLVEHKLDKAAIVLLAWLALSAAACELVYWGTGGIHLSTPHSQPFTQVLARNPSSVLQYLLLSFASSTIPADALEKHFHGLGHTISLLMGAGMACLYIGCTWIYLRLRMWKTSYMPAFLIAFSTLFILSTLAVRLPATGLEAATAPRYVLYSQLGNLGCLWILFQWSGTVGHLQRPPFLSPVSCFVAVFLLYALGVAALWDYYPTAVHDMEIGTQEIMTGDFDHPDWLCPDIQLCRTGRATLVHYRLQPFSDKSHAKADGANQP